MRSLIALAGGGRQGNPKSQIPTRRQITTWSQDRDLRFGISKEFDFWGSFTRLRRAWARLSARICEVNPLACPRCGSEMKVVAFIHDEDVVWRILEPLGLLAREDSRALPTTGPPTALPPPLQGTRSKLFSSTLPLTPPLAILSERSETIRLSIVRAAQPESGVIRLVALAYSS